MFSKESTIFEPLDNDIGLEVGIVQVKVKMYKLAE